MSITLNFTVYNARIRKGLSQNQAAKLIGITQGAYNHIENGKRTPSVKVAKKIAEVFGLPWSYVFDDPDKPKDEPK